MAVARVLTLWSSAALDCLQEETRLCPPGLRVALCGGSELQRHLLEHVYSHWEHPLDGVRHQTRSLFHNLLRLHQRTMPHSSDPAEDPYVTELTHSLLGLEWHMRGKYGSLGCLVELYGAERLLSIQPLLPSRLLELMGDQTLAPYASDLLERLFVSHKAQLATAEGTDDWMERWHRTWVNPLLHVLCHTRPDQTTYILDYFLPKLLRCSPSSLTHMVRALQDTRPCATGIKPTLVPVVLPQKPFLKNVFPDIIRFRIQQRGTRSPDDMPAGRQRSGGHYILRRGSVGGISPTLPAATGTYPQTRSGEFSIFSPAIPRPQR